MGALILNRDTNQVVWIGQTKMTILRAKSGRAMIMFEGPPEVQILRDEIATYLEDGTVTKKPQEEESPIGYAVRDCRQPSELARRVRQRLVSGRDDRPRVEGEAGRVLQGSRPEAGGMPHSEDGGTV